MSKWMVNFHPEVNHAAHFAVVSLFDVMGSPDLTKMCGGSQFCSRHCDRNFYCQGLAAKKTPRIAKTMCTLRNKGSHVCNIAVWSDA